MADVSPATYKLGGGRVPFELNVESGDTKALDPSGWNLAYVLDVEDGTGVLMGRGQSAAPNYAEGFAGIRLVSDSAAAQATGDVRLTVRTNQQRLVAVLFEGDLEEMDLFTGAAGSGSQKDRDSRRPFPRTSKTFETSEYDVYIEVRPDSAITIDDAESETKALIEGYLAERTR